MPFSCNKPHYPKYLLINIFEPLRQLERLAEHIEEDVDVDAIIANAFDCVRDRFTALIEISMTQDMLLEQSSGPLHLSMSYTLNAFEQTAHALMVVFNNLRLYRDGKLPFVIGHRSGPTLMLVRNDVYQRAMTQDANEQSNRHQLAAFPENHSSKLGWFPTRSEGVGGVDSPSILRLDVSFRY